MSKVLQNKKKAKGKKSAAKPAPVNGLKNLIPFSTAPTIPSVENRSTWTEEQIQDFLATGRVDPKYVVPDDEEAANEFNLKNAVRVMPPPRSLDSVFGGQFESEAIGTSGEQASNSGAAVASDTNISAKLNQTGILASLLDPDAGGQGRNKDGLVGLISAKPKPKIRVAPDARHPNESEERKELRARLQARLRASQNQRGKIQDSQIVYDSKGNRVKNARQPKPEDAPYVRRPGAGTAVDRDATMLQRQQMFENIRQQIATRASTSFEAPAQPEEANDVDDDSLDS